MKYLGQHKQILFRLSLISLFMLSVVFLPALCQARLGGGHSFSSGSSGGSSYSSSSYSGSSYSGSSYGSSYSSSGSGGDPMVTFVVIVLFVFFQIIKSVGITVKNKIFRYSKEKEYFREQEDKKEEQRQIISNALKNLQHIDPNFSKVLFLDFARLLFTRYLDAQGQENVNPSILKHFISKWLYKEIENKRLSNNLHTVTKISNVIIGRIEIKHIDETSGWMQIAVNLFVNFDEYSIKNPHGRTIVAEYTSYFNRKRDVLSPGPEEMRSLHCPGCGSPLSDDITGTCPSCGIAPSPGESQWQMRHVNRISRSFVEIEEHTTSTNNSSLMGINIKIPTAEYHTSALTESSTANVPTSHIDPMLGAELRELQTRDNEFSIEDFKDVVYGTFFKLQKAWSGPDFEESRPIQTESLYLTNLFWIDTYRKKNQKNILADPEIMNTGIVDIDCDAYYDSIKVFINAKGKDYTVNGKGEVISGDPDKSSTFTELWTFIRSVSQKNNDSNLTSCPNCGGHVESSSSAECPYCESILRGTKFKWILAFVEQVN